MQVRSFILEYVLNVDERQRLVIIVHCSVGLNLKSHLIRAKHTWTIVHMDFMT